MHFKTTVIRSYNLQNNSELVWECFLEVWHWIRYLTDHDMKQLPHYLTKGIFFTSCANQTLYSLNVIMSFVFRNRKKRKDCPIFRCTGEKTRRTIPGEHFSRHEMCQYCMAVWGMVRGDQWSLFATSKQLSCLSIQINKRICTECFKISAVVAKALGKTHRSLPIYFMEILLLFSIFFPILYFSLLFFFFGS